MALSQSRPSTMAVPTSTNPAAEPVMRTRRFSKVGIARSYAAQGGVARRSTSDQPYGPLFGLARFGVSSAFEAIAVCPRDEAT
jgi:hypothetical protein